MALRVIRETGRSLGYSLASGATIISGQPLMLASASTVKPYDASVTNGQVIGLALEDSEYLPLAGSGGITAGAGYDYTNFARGGMFSYICDGGEVELYSDGRGLPFETGDTYVIGCKVYANSSGKITSTSGSNPEVGICTSFTGSPVTVLKVKLLV